MTNKQLTINGLLVCGWKQDSNARTSKYTVFMPNDGRPDGCRFFVGRRGALRFSSLGKATDSISFTDTVRHKAFMEVGSPGFLFEDIGQAQRVYDEVLSKLRKS